MQRVDTLEKTLMLGELKTGEEDDREWDGWMASPFQHKESETTERLNNKNKFTKLICYNRIAYVFYVFCQKKKKKL